jgi:ribosome-binding protein aMBF1 (putative translation factor)
MTRNIGGRRNDSRKRSASAGWRTGAVRDFLGLSEAEVAYIEFKLALARAVRAERERRGLTQVLAARRLKSSQSRLAKMEAGDRTVSVDLLVRAYFGLGGSRSGLQRVARGG